MPVRHVRDVEEHNRDIDHQMYGNWGIPTTGATAEPPIDMSSATAPHVCSDMSIQI